MSVDFTFALAGPAQPLFELMSNIESLLEPIGFANSGEFYKVDLDNRGVFEEDEECFITGKRLGESRSEMQGWKGLSAEFNNVGSIYFTAYLLICNYENQYLNAFIEVSDRSLERIIKEDEIVSYMRLVSTVAVSIKAQGGFGTYELPFEPVPPEKILSYIFRTPEGVPSLLGLIPCSVADEVKVREMASSEFNVKKLTPAFHFLQHKHFLL